MSILNIIRADFEEFILLDPSVPDDLRKSLKVKERMPVFIDRLAAEIKQVESKGIALDRIKIKEIVYSLTGMFVHMLKTRAHEMQMSDAARSVARKEFEGDELTNKLDKEGNADLSEELGVIITDKGAAHAGRKAH